MSAETNEEILFNHAKSTDAYDSVTIAGEDYYIGDVDTPENFRRLSRHYALLAEFMESDDMKEHRRIRERRAEIAKRYGLNSQRLDHPSYCMINDILKLEEAAK